MGDLFWADYWQSLSSLSPDSTVPPSDILKQYRSIAKRKLDGISKTESKAGDEDGDNDYNDTFAVAWAAHSLITSPPATASLLAGCKSFSWKQKIGCVVILEACCGKFVAGDSLGQSPFFPLLVQDTLAAVRSTQLTTSLPPQTTRQEMEMERDCLLELAETFIPAMIGQDKFDAILKELDRGTVPPSLIQLLESAVTQLTSRFNDNAYMHPSIIAQKESDIIDVRRLIETCGELKQVSVQALLQPLPSLDIPFARPLPPPLLPLMGYHDDEGSSSDGEEAELLEYLHAELYWLTPTNLRLMLLPDDESEDKEMNERYKQALVLLQSQALNKPLAPNEQHTVLQVLGGKKGGSGSVEEDDERKDMADRLIKEWGLTPQNLPRLVEHNPLVANECALRVLCADDENEKNEYLTSLIGMDMSLHSMEVVNRLATHQPAILHPEYLHLFISSCIASCENVQDRLAQNRLVRLVCVFIQSLLRNKIVQVDDIFFELQSFCVEFSRIREASVLFKSIKQLSGG
jgi:hypothetical protein